MLTRDTYFLEQQKTTSRTPGTKDEQATGEASGRIAYTGMSLRLQTHTGIQEVRTENASVLVELVPLPARIVGKDGPPRHDFSRSGPLSQIESRLVMMMTSEPELVKLARLPSWEYDGHSANAALLFHGDSLTAFEEYKKAEPAKAKLQRHIGKITSHGSQRDMGGATLAGNILKELDIAYSADKCQGFIEKYHARYTAIRGVYFPGIRRTVMRDRRLVNSWGRHIDFRYDRLCDELFRQAYSWLPQSENADLLNQRGLYPLWLYMKSLHGYPPNVTVHDSLLVSVAPKDAYDVAEFIRSNIEQPMLIGGNRFTPFVEFKLGATWAGDREFKRIPSKQEFTDAAFAVNAKAL